MTTRNDLDQLLASFLEDGATELSDGALQAVRAGIDRTRQRVVIGPWREPPMSTLTRTAVILAVAVVVLAVGFAGLVGSPAPSASPSAAATPASTPAATPTAAPPGTPVPTLPPGAYTWPAPLAPGTYTTAFAWQLPLAVTFTVPAGWESRDIEVIKGSMSISIQVVDGTFADPCTGGAAEEPITGDGAADLASQIRALPSITAGATDAGRVAGWDAVHFTYAARSDAACVGETSRLWSLDENRIYPFLHLGGPGWPLRAGEHDVWIVEVRGTHLLVDATAGPNPTAADEAELAAVLDSLSFGSPTERQVFGLCTTEITDAGTGEVLSEPYRSTIADVRHPLLGPAPVDLLALPYAQLDFRVIGSRGGSGRPVVQLIPPWDSAKSGFATLTTVSEGDTPTISGSLLLDDPGTWWAQVSDRPDGCMWQLPFEATLPGG